VGDSTTIAAIASPPGAAARALIRISGSRTRAIVRESCRAAAGALELGPRGGYAATLFDGVGELPVLVLWMPAPASYTGEDVAELHLPGSPELVRAALERTYELGAQPAQPGEFTRRAFLNARIDLARAEGVLALVHARNEEQRRAASALLLGGLSARVEALREQLVDLRALVEAGLDFDENDSGGVPRELLAQRARTLLAAFEEALAWEVAREAPSGLPRVVLVGAPNAGKSSLFNRLAGACALVSELEGTTRDVLRGAWNLDDTVVELWDSAGTAVAQQAAAEPDRMAQQRSRELRAGADLWLWVIDLSRAGFDWEREWRELCAGQEPPPTLLVFNKLDAAQPLAARNAQDSLPPALARRLRGPIGTSAHQGAGLRELRDLAGRVLACESTAGEIRELSVRHHRALSEARQSLLAAQALLSGCGTPDLAAQELRSATEQLDHIAGRTTPEQVLDRIFARFCLGK